MVSDRSSISHCHRHSRKRDSGIEIESGRFGKHKREPDKGNKRGDERMNIRLDKKINVTVFPKVIVEGKTYYRIDKDTLLTEEGMKNLIPQLKNFKTS